ncbi:LPS-assembly protein LptD [Alterisphingorhabdus coralli]|uniref:LPS-assembly protein LptD n=1 Tax=Alterisphingorhabdus coralli TaxID=3071408 RepID=A0AA97F6N8_9SPHN|nr:LPS assembly protein LptD [Parasphingorhabdus sp. SCSIO 66989]WOE74257.1 LPS assembly protein LptD [Parasphingorhabdus sp. SCSIO 66989]
MAWSALILPATAAAQEIAEQQTNAEAGLPEETSEQSSPEASDNEREVEFSADTISYDSEADVVTASGDVIMRRKGQLLRAETIIWDRKSGAVTADGNVRIIDEQGAVLYGDNITLTEDVREGVIQNILLVLDEGGRIVANQGQRDGSEIILNEAAYTACAVQDSEGCPKSPSWQIKAVRVAYDEEDKTVRYEGARLELFGLPLIPLPGFSHPIDERNRSGLLVPNGRISQANGLEYSQPYYFALAPNRDLTVTPYVFSDVLPMLQTEYRALTERGAYQLTGYATASSRIPVGSREPLSSEEDFRGYFDGVGNFQLDENWNISSSIRVATDRTFLRRYDISRDDRLRSTFRAERIDSDSYFSLQGWATQTLRVDDPQGQVPIALPIVDFRQRMDDPVAGGQFEFRVNSLAIARTEGQDTQRAFASAQWDLRRVTPGGQLVTLTAYGRGDVYNSDENALTQTLVYRGTEGFQARAIGSVAADFQWPFVGKAFGGTQTLTPRVQLVATTPGQNDDIPNEDARAIELEASNLFALNRLPGFDRVEDGLRVVYGLDWNLQRPGLRIDANIGQSYRFNNKSDVIPEGTGLAEQTSDITGRTDVRFRDIVKFSHRYRLDKGNLSLRRNEIDATIGSRRTYFQVGYLRLNRDIGEEIEDLQDREELRVAGRVQLDQYWSVFGSGIFDLTDAQEDPTNFSDGFEPLRTRLGIAYDDDCISLGLTWRRDFVSIGDAPRGDSFLLRFRLRNLGI